MQYSSPGITSSASHMNDSDHLWDDFLAQISILHQEEKRKYKLLEVVRGSSCELSNVGGSTVDKEIF